MIAASQPASIVQTLLHDGPFALRSDDEAVEINLKSVGDGIVVDSRSEPAGANQPITIKTAAVCNQTQFLGRVARMSAPTTAEVDAEFICSRRQTVFQGTHNGCGDT